MNNTRSIIGIFLMALGIGALFNFNVWTLIWPMFLIFMGLRFMSRSNMDLNWSKTSVKETKQADLDESVIFGEINKKIKSSDFKGGKVTLIFGGGVLDLSQVETKSEEVYLEATAIFGGLKLIVPKNWRIEPEGTSIIGGFDNRAEESDKQDKTLRVKGTAIFGGVEIVN